MPDSGFFLAWREQQSEMHKENKQAITDLFELHRSLTDDLHQHKLEDAETLTRHSERINAIHASALEAKGPGVKGWAAIGTGLAAGFSALIKAIFFSKVH